MKIYESELAQLDCACDKIEEVIADLQERGEEPDKLREVREKLGAFLTTVVCPWPDELEG